MYVFWFNFILGLIIIFFCFKLIIIHYHAQKLKKLEINPKIKWNQNICDFSIMYYSLTYYWKQRSCLCQANVLANRIWVVVSWSSGLLRSPNDLLQNIEKMLNNTQTTMQKWTNNSFRNTKNRPVDCKDNHIEIAVPSSVQDYKLTVFSISAVQSMGIRALHSCKMHMIWTFFAFFRRTLWLIKWRHDRLAANTSNFSSVGLGLSIPFFLWQDIFLLYVSL